MTIVVATNTADDVATLDGDTAPFRVFIMFYVVWAVDPDKRDPSRVAIVFFQRRAPGAPSCLFARVRVCMPC